MKKYEKPNLTVFSLVGSENICGGCGEKLSQNDWLNELFDLQYGNADGTLTKEEASNLFGNEDSCSTKIEGYCKFTGIAQSIAWS